MNREEFKVLFAKQLNTNYSDALALMFCLDPLSRSDTSYYASRKVYSVDEFGLDIEIIKRKYGRLSGNSGFYFDIKYTDVPPAKGGALEKFRHLDEANFADRFDKSFCCESMDYLDGKIQFYLSFFALSNEGYVFKLSEPYKANTHLVYNLKTQSFDNPGDIEEALQSWKDFRESGECIYLDMTRTPEETGETKMFIQKEPIDDVAKLNLMAAFMCVTFCDPEWSVMTSIVKNLTEG